jgi:hypothetical protein
MSKSTNKLNTIAAAMFMLSIGSTALADDFQSVLNNADNCEKVEFISTNNKHLLDEWSMQGRVQRSQEEIEMRIKTRNDSVAAMEKPSSSTWLDNSGKLIKL